MRFTSTIYLLFLKFLCDMACFYWLSSCRKGGRDGAVKECKTCNGRGVKVTLRQIGPGMVQQMQSMCRDCRGEGEMLLVSFDSLCYSFLYTCINQQRNMRTTHTYTHARTNTHTHTAHTQHTHSTPRHINAHAHVFTCVDTLALICTPPDVTQCARVCRNCTRCFLYCAGSQAISDVQSYHCQRPSQLEEFSVRSSPKVLKDLTRAFSLLTMLDVSWIFAGFLQVK